MKKAILATKVGMTQIFNEDGVLTPVTVLQAGPCVVTQIKTVENDGYSAVQVGFVDKKDKIVNVDKNGKKEIVHRHGVTKAEKGHFDKAGVTGKRFVREFKFENADEYTVENLKDLNAVLLESNHDIHMLEVGPYPYYLKQRVLGDRGHLSNELSGRLLCDILHNNLRSVLLGHLSKENNYEELAYETVKLEVTLGQNPYKGDDIPIAVAKRDQVSAVIEV